MCVECGTGLCLLVSTFQELPHSQSDKGQMLTFWHSYFVFKRWIVAKSDFLACKWKGNRMSWVEYLLFFFRRLKASVIYFCVFFIRLYVLCFLLHILENECKHLFFSFVSTFVVAKLLQNLFISFTSQLKAEEGCANERVSWLVFSMLQPHLVMLTKICLNKRLLGLSWLQTYKVNSNNNIFMKKTYLG